jgi:hypothetical protein
MVKCNEKDCKKTAIYGYEYKCPIKCSKHREVNMLDSYKKLCEKCNKKRPSYGLIIGNATHCSKCACLMLDIQNVTVEK